MLHTKRPEESTSLLTLATDLLEQADIRMGLHSLLQLVVNRLVAS